MKNFVRIKFRSKDVKDIVISIEKWEAILASDANLIKYTLDNEKVWTGRTLNKSDIVYSEPDKDFSEAAEMAKRYDYYLDTEKNVVVQLEKGTIPESPHRYKRV